MLFAQNLLGMGRVPEALDNLEQALEAKATDLIWLGVRPMYDALRDQERFQKLVAAVGL